MYYKKGNPQKKKNNYIEEVKKMDNYEVNLDTLAIIPLNANETRIIEKSDDFVVNSSSMKIIDDGKVLHKGYFWQR